MSLLRTLAVAVTWLTLIDVVAAAVTMVKSLDRYGVMADAGSSATKIMVYRWRDPEDVGELPDVELLTTGKVRPGLGNYVNDPEGLQAHLSQVIDTATHAVPSALHAATPIYVMSTAGTRVFTPNVAKDFTRTMERYLANASLNPFLFHPRHAQILSGEEEGVYGWIALNYLRGFFRKNSPVPESVGILEMGGGSTQMAFVPDVPLYADEFHVRLLGRRHDLYVHSHLQFGMDYLQARVRSLLVQDSARGTGDVTDPCQLRGDESQFQVGGSARRLLGSGNPDQCLVYLRKLVYRARDEDCLTRPCGLGAIYQPPVVNHTFFAVQAFVHAPRTVRAIRHDGSLDFQLLASNARTYCRKTLEQAQAEYGANRKYASNECFQSLYFSVLLEVYGFTQNSRVFVTSKLDDKAIDWTLGAILYEISSRTKVSFCPALGASTGAAPSVSLSLASMALSLLLVVMATRT